MLAVEGLKLEKAMDKFGVTLDKKICMDVGAFYRWLYRLHASKWGCKSLFC